MAKRTVSFADYEEPTWEEYQGEDPPPNTWLTAICKKAKYDAEEDEVAFILEVSEGDYQGWGRGWYAPFEGDRKWKMHEILRALRGGKTTDVTLDWANEKAVETWLKTAKPLKLKTQLYNDKITIKKVAPLLEGLPGAKAPAAAPKASREAETVDDTDAGDEPIEDYTAEELGEMEVSELEEILTDEFEFPKDDEDFPQKGSGRGAAAKYKAALVEAILEEQSSGDEDGEGDADEGDDDNFEDGFDQDAEPEPEPEPEPAPRARRSRAAKPAPAKAAPAKATTSTRRRRS